MHNKMRFRGLICDSGDRKQRFYGDWRQEGMKRCSLYLLLFVGVLPACRKHSGVTVAPPIPPGTVFVAGDNGNNPVLWTNGSPQTLSSSAGSAFQVTVSGNDVYVAGVYGSHYDGTPAGPSGLYGYWKNGSVAALGGQQILRNSSSIAVAGGSLYYANGQLWRNGAQSTLPGQGNTGTIRAVYAAGSDIYAVGSDDAGNPVYWKNGVLNAVTTVNPASGIPVVSCIFVAGNDVYTGGIDAGDHAAYWINGVETELAADSGYTVSQLRDIFVSGSDVYIAGSYFGNSANSGSLKPAYWKNGMEQVLPLNNATEGQANSIFVSGSDVYVAGATSAGAVLWKNGVTTLLGTNGSANSVYVH